MSEWVDGWMVSEGMNRRKSEKVGMGVNESTNARSE